MNDRRLVYNITERFRKKELKDAEFKNFLINASNFIKVGKCPDK